MTTEASPRQEPEDLDHEARPEEPDWLDVRALAHIHASSEDSRHPIAPAFSPVAAKEWRAAEPGVQVIEVLFREPRDLTRIRLVFEDVLAERTQQVTVTWASRRGETHGEVVRQQFNFSPSGATREVEDYRVELHGVETLQIRIMPDMSGRRVFASLAGCRLA